MVSPTVSLMPLGAGGPTISVLITYWYGVPSEFPDELMARKLMLIGTAANVACAVHADGPCAGGIAASAAVGRDACQPTRSCTRTLNEYVAGVAMTGSVMFWERRPQHRACTPVAIPRSPAWVQSDVRLAQTSRLSTPVKPESVTLNWSVMSAVQSR